MDQLEQIAHKALNYAQKVLYFPVRHHSPACSHHLLKCIDKYRPESILIEGPRDAGKLIPLLNCSETVAPVNIYNYFRDTKGLIGDKDGIYHSYFPFLDYSPEYVALLEAEKRGIESSFIDLAYRDYLFHVNSSKESYNHDEYFFHSKYIERLCRDEECRNFNELWEKLFEMEGLFMETEEFCKTLLGYCLCARSSYSEKMLSTDGTSARENAMAEAIKKESSLKKRTLVVCGGFHISGIIELLKGDPLYPYVPELSNIDESAMESYVMAGSFRKVNQLNGYLSGMPHPSFYQTVWDNIKNRAPYSDSVLRHIALCAGSCRDYNSSVSLADEIEAYELSLRLNRMRNKKCPGVYELIDSVRAGFIKSDDSVYRNIIDERLFHTLQGDRLGTLSAKAKMPPLVVDFYNKVDSFSLKISNAENSKTLDLYKNQKHRKISHFFHILQFLGNGFASPVYGPDLVRSSHVGRKREKWIYSWKETVIENLTENSKYGGSLYEAAANKVLQLLKKRTTDSEEASRLLILSLVMGLKSSITTLVKAIDFCCRSDRSFSSLCKCLTILHSILENKLLQNKGHHESIEHLVSLCFQRAVTTMHSIKNCSRKRENETIEDLKEFYSVILKYDFCDRDLFLGELHALTKGENCNGAVNGAACGLLYGLKYVETPFILKQISGYLNASGDRLYESAQFLKGLFTTGRDILFLDESGLISGMNLFLKEIDEEVFLKLLPDLKIAFSYFTPAEIDCLAEKILFLFKGKQQGRETFYGEMNMLGEMERDITSQLDHWGVFHG